jgi:hypothetical protein
MRALRQLLNKLLSLPRHSDQLPNVLVEQLFSVLNETLIKPERTLNFQAERRSRSSGSIAGNHQPQRFFRVKN